MRRLHNIMICSCRSVPALVYSFSYQLITVLKLVFSTRRDNDLTYIIECIHSVQYTLYTYTCSVRRFLFFTTFTVVQLKNMYIYKYTHCIVYCILLNDCSLYTLHSLVQSYLCIMCTYIYRAITHTICRVRGDRR